MPAAMFALQLINQMIPLISAGTALYTQFQEHRNSLETMISQKRDPTDAEWAALNTNITALRAQLQGA